MATQPPGATDAFGRKLEEENSAERKWAGKRSKDKIGKKRREFEAGIETGAGRGEVVGSRHENRGAWRHVAVCTPGAEQPTCSLDAVLNFQRSAADPTDADGSATRRVCTGYLVQPVAAPPSYGYLSRRPPYGELFREMSSSSVIAIDLDALTSVLYSFSVVPRCGYPVKLLI